MKNVVQGVPHLVKTRSMIAGLNQILDELMSRQAAAVELSCVGRDAQNRKRMKEKGRKQRKRCTSSTVWLRQILLFFVQA